jgi:hypothetical protein
MSGREWVVGAIGEAAFEQLAQGLAGSELQSVLLEVVRRRARDRAPAEVLAQYARDGFVRPAAVDLRTSVAIDAELLGAADAFEAVELSPVAPLGACSAVALTDQNRVLSALRGTEVVSDPTNVLALECALRMRARPAQAVHLVTCQRVVRAQPVPKLPGYAPHFRIFVMASGGVESKDHAFTVEALALHVKTTMTALDRLERAGYAFGARRVEVRATAAREALGDRVAEAVRAALSAPAAGAAGDVSPLARAVPAVVRTPLDHAYYSGGLRWVLWVTAPDGAEIPLVDGGTFDWLSKLTSNRRAVYVATGAGAQLIAVRFKGA